MRTGRTRGSPPSWAAGEYGADLAAPARPRQQPALPDRPRSGRPEVYGPDVRLAIVATATSVPPEGVSVWTHALIAGLH
jgi:hypothetical protein